MKKLVLFLFIAVSGGAMAQPPIPSPPKPPIGPLERRDVGKDLKTQGSHVKSSGDDLLHLRFKKAHKKHVAEARRKNRGLGKDLGIKGKFPPPPPPPKIPKPD